MEDGDTFERVRYLTQLKTLRTDLDDPLDEDEDAAVTADDVLAFPVCPADRPQGAAHRAPDPLEYHRTCRSERVCSIPFYKCEVLLFLCCFHLFGR